MEILLGICLGVGLSAACGFRIFVPPLVMSIAAQSGHLQLSDDFAWMSTPQATVAFGLAAFLEVLTKANNMLQIAAAVNKEVVVALCCQLCVLLLSVL